MGKQEQQLTQRVKDLQADIKRSKEKRKADKRKLREKTAYDKLPPHSPRVAFWCKRCRVDFVVPAYKTWSEVHQTGAWHSFCPLCEALVYRHITSKVADPYYKMSEKIKVMQGENLKDMLQPGQYGFRTMYGEPYEHYYKRFQEQHETLHNKYAGMGLVGKTIAQKTEEEVAKEMLQEYVDNK